MPYKKKGREFSRPMSKYAQERNLVTGYVKNFFYQEFNRDIAIDGL